MGIETAIIGSAVLGAASSRSAAKTQAGAADRSAELQQKQYEQTRQDQAPYRQAGYNALRTLQRTAGNVPGAFSYDNQNMPAAFSFNNEAMFSDPGYAFRLSEGQKQLDRTAAIRGGQISGSALKAAARYGQDMGSQEYANAYNRALTGYNANVNRENQVYNRALTGYNTGVASENQLYNRQAGLAGIGQTATNLVGQAGQNYATNAGNALGAAGQAQASGYMGVANAIGGGVGQYLNYGQQQQQNSLLQQVLNRNQSSYGMGPQYGQQPLDSSFDQYLVR